MSFCSSWLPAWRAAVSSVISQKWETQLKWQVAASSCYDKRAEMRRVAGSGASTAAESLSLERTRSTSGGLNLVYPRLGTPFPRYLIWESTEKLDLLNGGFMPFGEMPVELFWSQLVEPHWSRDRFRTPAGLSSVEIRAGSFVFISVQTGMNLELEQRPASAQP